MKLVLAMIGLHMAEVVELHTVLAGAHHSRLAGVLAHTAAAVVGE